MTAPIRIEVAHRLPVSVHDGFDYITDPTNWPEYWPRLVRITSASRWREPGDRACLVLRMLRREVELEMKLVRIEPYRLVEYTSEQRGLPSARHWRHFEQTDDELGYRISVEYQPRPGGEASSTSSWCAGRSSARRARRWPTSSGGSASGGRATPGDTRIRATDEGSRLFTDVTNGEFGGAGSTIDHITQREAPTAG
jgi:uncharacterized protein YndB with AHSA1/START domain